MELAQQAHSLQDREMDGEMDAVAHRPPAHLQTQTKTVSVISVVNGLVKTETVKTTVAKIMWMPTVMAFATITRQTHLPATMAEDRDTAVIENTTDNKRSLRMRNEQEVNRAIELYSDTIRRLCMIHLKNHADTEDIFQTVFLKYVLSSVSFENEEHEKAWFIRVTINACKDLLKSFFRSRTVSLDDVLEQPAALPEDNRDILEAVLSLPQKYREVVYLHYYEEYSAPQISRILGKNVNTIYTLLTRSRQMLREMLGGDEYE